jgi:hypothetical protein
VKTPGYLQNLASVPVIRVLEEAVRSVTFTTDLAGGDVMRSCHLYPIMVIVHHDMLDLRPLQTYHVS